MRDLVSAILGMVVMVGVGLAGGVVVAILSAIAERVRRLLP